MSAYRISIVAVPHSHPEPSEVKPKRERNAFPTPSTAKGDGSTFWCPAQRVIDLYNKEHGDRRQKLTTPVKNWFHQKAQSLGWAGSQFLPDTQTGNMSGCVLQSPRTMSH